MRNYFLLPVILFVLNFYSLSAQTVSVYEMPRVVVFGESSVEVEAETFSCWLNITDNSFVYDYSDNTTYDPKRWKIKQQTMIDQLGVKDFMINPTYAALSGYSGSGPFELKFNSKQQYEATAAKVQAASNEEIAVYLEIYKTDISAERRKLLTNQTVDAALADAKSKAERLAKGLNVVLGAPLFIEETAAPGYYDYSDPYGYPPVNSQLKITSRVQVQFELKK